MKRRNLIVISLAVIVIIGLSCTPVRASNPQSYTYTDILEYDGVWNTYYHKAVELYTSNTYRCNVILEYGNVDTDADDYWIEFHYNGETPGYFWQVESLQVSYRWGRSGGFTNIALFDIYAYDDSLDISAASSSVLQLKFRGVWEDSDPYQQNWLFDSEPVLWAYWS